MPFMGRAAKKRAAKRPKLRRWRASLISKRGEYLGYVEAVDRAAAEAAAVEEFKLTAEQQKRLVVQEET